MANHNSSNLNDAYNSTDIVYQFGGKKVVVSLAEYLAECPENTEDDFWDLKKLSDEDIRLEAEGLDVSESPDRMVPVGYWLDGMCRTLAVSCAVRKVLNETDNKEKALEKQDKRHLTTYIEGASEMAMALPPESVSAIVEQEDACTKLLANLTPAQRRRFRLYSISGYSIAEIAQEEGVVHQAVSQSILAVRKKIKNIRMGTSKTTP